MNYNSLRNIITDASQKSKYFEKDFFPKKTLRTKKGRFELLALSILDVRGFDADILWYVVGKNLRANQILSIEHLLNSSVAKITSELKHAEYRRGEYYTSQFAERLKKLAYRVKTNYNGDISNIFLKYKEHDRDSVLSILDELDSLPGVGQKISTMFLKFMVSTFGIWKWKDKNTLIGVPTPNDFQLRKVFLRLGHNRSNDMEKQYSHFGKMLRLPFMEIDDVLWNVGRIFCSKRSPSCHYCPFVSECHYADLRRLGKTEQLEKINLTID